MSKSVQSPVFDGYLTVRQVAERYPVTEAQLHGWRAKGEGPAFVKVGSRIRYPEAETAAWFAALAEDASPSESGVGMTAGELAAGVFLRELGELLERHHQGYHAMIEADPEVLLGSGLLLGVVQLYDQADRGYGRLVSLAGRVVAANPERYRTDGDGPA